MSAIDKAVSAYTRTESILNANCEVVKKFDSQTEQSTLSIYKEEIDKSWSDFYLAYEKLEVNLTGKKDDDLKKYLTEFGAMHNKFITARITISQYLTALTGHSETSSLETSMQSTQEASIRPNIKLPPIQIKPFNGNFDDWPEFKAACNSVFTDKISEVQRLQYLKDLLRDEPRDLVKHIAPEEGAYNAAWVILKMRYDNTRAIVNSCLKRFFEIPILQTESADGLKHMLNTTHGTLATLKGFHVDTNSWDTILVYILSRKLDANSVKHWEESQKGSKSLPALSLFHDFLDTRISILNNTAILLQSDEKMDQKVGGIKAVKPAYAKPQPIMLTLKTQFKCFLCNDNHIIARCPVLSQASTSNRIKMINEKSLCCNCLNRHKTEDCPYTPNCKNCDANHHSLLHEVKGATIATTIDECYDENIQYQEQIHHVSEGRNAILATALFPVEHNGKTIVVRALLDQCATGNLITTRLCQLLNLPLTSTYVPLTGPCDVRVGSIKEKTSITIGSNFDKEFSLTFSALVVKTVTGLKPVQVTEPKKWSHLRGLPLADPKYLEFSHIDMLVGSIVFAEILQNGLVKGNPGEPIAQLTSFGWIITGAANKIEAQEVSCNMLLEQDNLKQQLSEFWQLEEVSNKKLLSIEEQQAEDIFATSVQICPDGHIMVDLPFKSNPIYAFGESYAMAKSRLKSLQRRLSRDANLEKQYNEVIREYLTLGHMTKAAADEKPFVCLPHHAVIKESSSTTKVRGVFDASAKTSNGKSLNDLLCVGPTIQPDLFELLIRWRRFQYAFSGDIEKMYRQVRINPKQANFQSILWQPPGETEIQRYKLETVTFGTASAPFQAVRTLHEIANRIKNKQPVVAANILLKFYVDDYLGCEKTIEEARMMRTELTTTLAKFGFNLRKWKASHHEILEEVSESDKETILDFDSTIKTLGIKWNPSNDEFIFKSCTKTTPEAWTKRLVLSEIAKLFDPLGWMAPCVIKAKIIMQNIWKENDSIGWDDPLTENLLSQWIPIYEQLCIPIPIKIPRWIGLSNELTNIEFHGFSDASMAAYAATIYIRLFYTNGKIECNLVAAKTKVAPINPIVTIPRLELCGTLLLARLFEKVKKSFDVQNVTTFSWTDSMITLSWLSSHPSKWSTFVANRTSEVLKILPFNVWRHVPTKENPADAASRGLLIDELDKSSIWWHGPEFLSKPGSNWLQSFNPICDDELPEHRKAIHTIQIEENHILSYFSDFNKLLRFTIYAQRWLKRSKKVKVSMKSPIIAEEINEAELKWIEIIQYDHFSNEIQRLRNGNEVSQKSMLAPLNPFIDGVGIVRMNGRVNNKDLEAQKIAIILPSKNKFTELLIRSVHSNEAMHGGLQITLRTLRERFWIVHARNTVKGIIRKCVICFRFNKSLLKQKMSELPLARTQQARPFAYVGCDYAGFFDIKTSERRNAPYAKGYIALFICLCTKAIHLEMVTSLSTADFVMAFENFVSRRGIPEEFHSDNGTNFIGGKAQIQQLHDQMYDQNNELTKYFASKRIKFKNIPARASHMGGIWERSVGLVKAHLYRVLKDVRLTARHFDHLLKQIEACLNSRPLWTVSSEVDDGEVLTPSHFFNFQPINTIPKPDVSHIPLNRLDQYQYLHRLYNDFWKSWSKDYLNQLQPRSKWQRSQENLKVGQVVIVSDDNAPPSRWKLGRITGTYPGKDGLIRVVDVMCSGHILKRPIHRLGLLPIADNEIERMQPFNAGENVNEQ